MVLRINGIALRARALGSNSPLAARTSAMRARGKFRCQASRAASTPAVVPSFPQDLTGHLDIVKRNSTFACDLYFFVAFPRQVVRCLPARLPGWPVRLPFFRSRSTRCTSPFRTLQADHCIVHDGQGIFTAGVVGGQHHETHYLAPRPPPLADAWRDRGHRRTRKR